MSRKYDLELLQKLKERCIVESYKGAPLIIKQLPDSDEIGAIDPRLYEDMKPQLRMLKYIPKSFIKMDTSEKGVQKLRKTFNNVKSIPTCETEIHTKKHLVKMEDGAEIDVYQYTSKETKPNMPVLYYIHGGGFFGGHHGVVEESLKLMCEKFAFPIFSVDYRLAPEYPYPIGHKDCFSVLKWIYENGEKLNINKDLIFVAGDSAGGNLTQYCSTRDIEEETMMVKGQLLLYPTLNMANIEDEYFKWELSHYKLSKRDKVSLMKMLSMFGDMAGGMESILKTTDTHNDYLNPYTKDPAKNPPTFITVGEHDYLKVEAISYAAKLHNAGIDVKTVIYNGMGHAYFDNTGVYPQCEDCIEEMGQFILEHCK